ncbi:MAG: DUF4390 domain-containing protein [Deltaproteobacteria bacterium]|nr:DUF4390 domain-containing protein [Deltaproteobacteria bacterium]
MLFLLTLLVVLTPPLVHARQARLSDIVVTNTAEHLIVYFSVEDCFTAEMVRAIESGLPTTFTFYVQLDERREFWWDRTVAELEVRHTVRYDQLKRHYELRFSEEDNEVVTVQDFEDARRLMSEVAALKVIPLDRLEKGGRYQIRMMAELDKIRLPLYLHYVLFFLSLWDFETDWYAVDFRY